MSIHRFLGGALLAAIACSLAVAAPVAKRLPTHEDIWLMKRLGAPQPSPDGRWVVVSILDPSYDDATQYSDLWLIDTSGREHTRRLTSTPRNESGVNWSADSRRIVFSTMRDQDDVNQIYLLDLAGGGEAQRLTNLSGGARSPKLSPDGRHLAFVTLMFPGASDDAANKAEIESRRLRKWNARIYEGFPIRSWDRWLDERQPRVFVVDLDANGAPVGAPRNLLAGSKLVTLPGFAGRQTDTGEEIDLEFTPDSSGLVFAASTNRDAAAIAFTDSQLFHVGLVAGEPVRLTEGNDIWSRPRFAPDGKTLLALHEPQTENVYNAARIATFQWPAPGTPTVITAGLDRAVDTFTVTPDSRQVYFTADDSGNERLFTVAITGGEVQPRFAIGKGSFSNVAIPERARLTLYGIWESASSPQEVVSVNPRNGQLTSFTKFNATRAAQLDLPEVENFWFTSSRGKRIHSLLVRPPGFDPAKQYPLFVLIHGGPHSMWRDHFFVRWNFHLLAAPGYVLLLTNYSGSTGFGQAFAQSIQGDPLKGPAEEINEAADAAIARYGFIDGERQCAGGASYGGHLSNWLQGTTTRYRCLVSHAGLVNLEAQWGSSDSIYAREVNLGGPPWEQSAPWREQNPIRLAKNFRTPTLVTIGENDYRVPLNNSLEYWSALQRMSVPSRLVVFPEENHWIQKGENSRIFYREVHAWLQRWLKAERD